MICFEPRPVGEVRAGQVGRAAHELGQHWRQTFDGQLRSFACGDRFGLLVGLGNQRIDAGLPIGRQFALHAALELRSEVRELLLVGGEGRIPLGFQRLALQLGVPGVVDRLGNFERRMRPANGFTRGGDFLVAQRGAVHVVRTGLVGRAFADDGLAADQRRLVLLGLGCDQSGLRVRDMPFAPTDDEPAAVLDTWRASGWTKHFLLHELLP